MPGKTLRVYADKTRLVVKAAHIEGGVAETFTEFIREVLSGLYKKGGMVVLVPTSKKNTRHNREDLFSNSREVAVMLNGTQEKMSRALFGGSAMTPRGVIRAAWKDMCMAMGEQRPKRDGTYWATSILEMVYGQQSQSMLKYLNGKAKLTSSFQPERTAICTTPPNPDIRVWVSCLTTRKAVPHNLLFKVECPVPLIRAKMDLAATAVHSTWRAGEGFMEIHPLVNPMMMLLRKSRFTCPEPSCGS